MVISKIYFWLFSFEKHIRKCKWRRHGYTHSEVKQILDEESSLERSDSSVKLGNYCFFFLLKRVILS